MHIGKCHGCGNPKAEDILPILGFDLCYICRIKGTTNKISPLILTEAESLAMQKDFELKERRNGANVYGEFCVILH